MFYTEDVFFVFLRDENTWFVFEFAFCAGHVGDVFLSEGCETFSTDTVTTFEVKDVFGFIANLTGFVEDVVTCVALFLFNFGFGWFFGVVDGGRGGRRFMAVAGCEWTGVVAFTVVLFVIIIIIIVVIVYVF